MDPAYVIWGIVAVNTQAQRVWLKKATDEFVVHTWAAQPSIQIPKIESSRANKVMHATCEDAGA